MEATSKEQELRQKCYELALRSISVSNSYQSESTTLGGRMRTQTVEPNYTKKAQEIYDYITTGKVKQ